MKKYEKLKELGKGCIGTVCLYKHIDKGDVYAIKKVPVEGLKGEDSQEIEEEASLLKNINSTYVVKCYDSFIEDFKLYLVFEYCPGETLRDFLYKQKSPLDENLIWEIFLKICLGLAAFHTQYIPHKDLKPENIFIGDRTFPKIGSSGLSMYYSSKDFPINLVGNILYLPPEILKDKLYNQKSDIWCLGVILYELCTLKPPFSNIPDIIDKNPKEISDSYSQDLKNLINELLQKDRMKRPDLFQLFNKENIQNKLYVFTLLKNVVELYGNSLTTILDEFSPKRKQTISKFKSFKVKPSIFDMCLLKDGRLVTIRLTNKIVSGIFCSKIAIHNKYSYVEELSIKIDDERIDSIFTLRNGKLVTVGYNLIRIWEIDGEDYRHLQTVTEHNGRIKKVIELEDGKLCSSSTDKEINIWDNNNNKYQCIKALKTYNFYFIEDIIEINDYIVSINILDDKGVMMIWNKHTFELIKQLEQINCCLPNALSKLKDNTLIMGTKEGLLIIDLLSFQSKLFKDARLGNITKIFVLREDQVLVGNSEGKIICYDSFSNQITLFQQVCNKAINCIITNKNGQIILTSEDYTFSIYNII